MARNDNNNVSDPADILNGQNNQQNQSDQNNDTAHNAEVEYLKSIDRTLKQLLQSGGRNMSHSEAQSAFNSRRDFRDREAMRRQRSTGRNDFSDVGGSIADGLEEALMDGFLGTDFKRKLGNISEAFAFEFGLNLQTLRKDLGKEIGRQAIDAFKGSSFGSKAIDRAKQFRDTAVTNMRQRAEAGFQEYDRRNNLSGDASFTARYRRAMERAAHNDSVDSSFNDRQRDESTYTNRQDSSSNQSSSRRDTSGRAAITDSNWKDEFIDAFDLMNTSLTNIQKLTLEISKAVGGNDVDLSQFDPRQHSQEDVLPNGAPSMGDIAGQAVQDVGPMFAEMVANGEGLTAIVSALGPALLESIGPMLALTAAVWVVDKALDQLTPAIEGAKKMFDTIKSTANRAADERKKNLQAEQDRILADVKTLIEEPFKILEKAATDLYNAWDNNIRVINGTQGYTKDELHSLMSTYSERLKSEGLSSVISSATITDNLAKVLESGLSGPIADEFAYLATVLNGAIPTQDFFSYADQYAALAGSALAAGQSQQQAIQYANKELSNFASNILYASRNLSDGFTTGLQNSSKILEDSIKIAQSAKSNNVAEISGVLSSVSAIVGSVAPDIAASITDVVTRAAIGGNSSDIVALRSLSGVNAGNTEFLRQFVNNPKEIFSTLFKNLANMQSMSEDAFMEVAEGLSDVFGVSMDAFARVDFNYLASSISAMNTNSSSLEENLKHLASGQTTTSSEMLKMQQINKYMIEEGLAYVIDSEEARFIQQHLWDEQIARQMTEATYGVELRGSALEFLEGLQTTVRNILGFLNPFMLIGKFVQVVGSAVESQAQRADTAAILKAVKVGNGRGKDLEALTITNRDHKLVGNLAELINGTSAYSSASGGRDLMANMFNPFGGESTKSATEGLKALGALGAQASNILSRTSAGGRASVYSWGTVTKSQASMIAKAVEGRRKAAVSSTPRQASQDAANQRAQQLLAKKMMSATELMGKQDKNGKMKYAHYEDWKKDAERKVGKKNWEDALEAAGITENDLQSAFESHQAQQGAVIQQKRLENEEDFWQAGKDFWRADEFRVREFAFWETTMTYQRNQLAKTTEICKVLSETTNKILSNIDGELKSLHKDWVDYYIRYTTYGDGSGKLNAAGRQTYSYTDVAKIANKEKKESYDAVHALAEALNKNVVDLHDPQVQTNALLGKILLVAEAILQQNQTGTEKGSSTQSTFNSLVQGLLG